MPKTRYTTLVVYKETNKTNFIYLTLDLFVAAFLGFLLFKVYADYNMTENQGLILSTICGNIGSRSLYLLKKYLNNILKI